MAAYPDEPLPTVTMSLQEFNEVAQGLLTRSAEAEDDPLRHAFTNFVLAGRYVGPGGQEQRVHIDVMKNIEETRNLANLSISRDYDSLIGISDRLPFRCSLGFYPLPNFRECLSKTNHLKWCVSAPDGGRAKHVSLHLIPNICLARASLRQKTLLFFPKIYEDDGSGMLSQLHLANLYDQCMLPTISAVCPELLSHWPPGYQAALKQCKDRRGKFSYPTLDVPAGSLQHFNRHLRLRLDEFPEFQDSFYVHEWRGTKGVTLHSLDDEEEIDAAFDTAMEVVDLEDLGDPPNLETWYIDVGVEVRCPEHVVQWLDDRHDDILAYALPHQPPDGIQRILRSAGFHRDVSALLYDLAGFRVEVKTAGAEVDLAYLNVYTTDKSPTYQLHSGSFRRHRTQDLLPTQIGQTLRDIDALGVVYDMCAGSTATGGIQEGCARLEGRVKMARGAMLTKFLDISREMLDRTVVAIPAATWWSFKVWRLTALRNVIEVLQNDPPGIRVLRPSLRLGAVAVWMLNALIFRPGDQRWDRELVPATAAHGPRVEEEMEEGVAAEPGEEEDEEMRIEMAADVVDGVLAEMDEEVFPDAVQEPLAEIAPDMLDNAVDEAMLKARGCYFVAAVEADHGSLRCAITRDLDLHSYCVIYNVSSLEELEHLFRDSAQKSLRKMQGYTRRKRNRAVFEGDRNSPERDIALGLEDAGVELRKDVALTGRDIPADGVGQGGHDEENAISARVNKIWRQWLRDILRVAPTSSRGPYCTLTGPEIDAVTEETYKNTTVPFREAWVKMAERTTWNLLFDRFFPSRSLVAEARNRAPSQHYGSCGYWLQWLSLIEKTVDDNDAQIRERLRMEFNKLVWMPWGKTDRMWAAGKTETGYALKLPEGSKESAVKLAVNPASGTRIDAMRLAPY